MSACGECLARAALLRALAANVDRAVDQTAHRRARDLLALDDERLAQAVTPDPGTARRALAEARGAVAGGELSELVEASGCWSACRHDGELWPSGLARLEDAAPRRCSVAAITGCSRPS